MKKILCISVLFICLLAVGPVYAGSIDGLWTLSAPTGELVGFGMARENYGILLFVTLSPDLTDWQAFAGSFNGTSAPDLTTVVSQDAVMHISLVLTSPSSGTATITSCTPIVPDGCDVPVGLAIQVQKAF